MSAIPIYGNLRFNISQVEQITGVRKTTLRFWEKSFANFLSVERARGQRREYSADDVDKVLTLKTLLRDERYTIHGARRRLGLMEDDETDPAATRGTPAVWDARTESDETNEEDAN